MIDNWIEPRLATIDAAMDSRPILELGCGDGVDTLYLEQHGYKVIAADIRENRLQQCAVQIERSMLLCHDLRDPFPFTNGAFPVIVASLCLHYFPWDETESIVAEIRRCLPDGGLLLCRLNSTRDIHFGAKGYPAADPINGGAYYQYKGRRKRFFDEQSVGSLFETGWTIVSLSEQTIYRYSKPKVVWEAILRKYILSEG